MSELAVDPHRRWAQLRAHGPVAYIEELGGWVVLTHREATAVMRNSEQFTVDDPRFSTGAVVGPSMLSLDGQEHMRHRQPYSPLGRARFAAGYQSAVERAVATCISGLGPGSVELRSAVAGPLAVRVTAELLGIAPDVDRLRDCYDEIVAAVTARSLGHQTRADGAMQALADMLSSPEATPTPIMEAAAQRLNQTECRSNAAVLLFGGIETSEALNTTALWAALSRPSWWQRLANGDDRWAAAITEEALRWEPAATRVDRYARENTTIGGTEIARGDLVIVSLAAANRDPACFAEPDRFWPDRPDEAKHLSFAVGPHLCLGLHLARAQSCRLLLDMAAKYPDAALAGEPVVEGLVFRKPVELWAKLTP